MNDQHCHISHSLARNSEYDDKNQEGGNVDGDYRAYVAELNRDFASTLLDFVDIRSCSLPRRIGQQQQNSSLQELLKFDKRKKFPTVLHDILTLTDHISHDFLSEEQIWMQFHDIVCWDIQGRSFTIKDKHKLVHFILPHFFPHQNEYASFQRQLNWYGFKCLSGRKAVLTETSGQKITNIESPDQSLTTQHVRYYHELFIKTRVDLCHNIHRKSKNDILVNRHRPSSSKDCNNAYFEKCPVLLDPVIVEASPKTNKCGYGQASNFAVDANKCQNSNTIIPAILTNVSLDPNCLCLNTDNSWNNRDFLNLNHFDYGINPQKYQSVTHVTTLQENLSYSHDFNIISSQNHPIIEKTTVSTISSNSVPNFIQYPQFSVDDNNQGELSLPFVLKSKVKGDEKPNLGNELHLKIQTMQSTMPQPLSYERSHTLTDVLTTSKVCVQNQAIMRKFNPTKSYVLETNKRQSNQEESWIISPTIDLDVFAFSRDLASTKKRQQEDVPPLFTFSSHRDKKSLLRKPSCINHPDTNRKHKSQNFGEKTNFGVNNNIEIMSLKRPTTLNSNREKINAESKRVDTISERESTFPVEKSLQPPKKIHRSASLDKCFKQLSEQEQSDLIKFFSEFRFEGCDHTIDKI